MKKVFVRVPASTSNLGPGFDVLGASLKLYNDFEAWLLPKGAPISTIEVFGHGAGVLMKRKKNLTLLAAEYFLRRQGFKRKLHIRAQHRIPIGRGLGSSAAASLGGLLAANALYGSPLSRQDIFKQAAALEGHADNVAASLYGGLCIASGRSEDPPLRLPPPKYLSCVFVIPDFELKTEQARRLLPKAYSRETVVASQFRLAQLMAALTKNQYAYLRQAMQDVLHQPFRSRLIPGFYDVINAACLAGSWGAALSGAGPSMLAFCSGASQGQKIGRAMQQAFARHKVSSHAMILDFDHGGSRVTGLSG